MANCRVKTVAARAPTHPFQLAVTQRLILIHGTGAANLLWQRLLALEFAMGTCNACVAAGGV